MKPVLEVGAITQQLQASTSTATMAGDGEAAFGVPDGAALAGTTGVGAALAGTTGVGVAFTILSGVPDGAGEVVFGVPDGAGEVVFGVPDGAGAVAFGVLAGAGAGTAWPGTTVCFMATVALPV